MCVAVLLSLLVAVLLSLLARPAVLLSLLPHPSPRATQSSSRAWIKPCTQQSEKGWPLWLTSGEGGNVPLAKSHDFGKDRLQHGARVDFSRGSAKDDRGNQEWSTRWLQQLPQYKSTLTQDPRSDNGRGNAVEQAAGVAFAAVTNEEHLAHGRLDWTRSGAIESCKSAWASAWKHFQALVLGSYSRSCSRGF